MSRNLAASIRARLKQHADAAKQGFNLILTHHGLERLFLRPLLFSQWYDLPHRLTHDADLLGFGPDDIDSVVATFHEILSGSSAGQRSCSHGGSRCQ